METSTKYKVVIFDLDRTLWDFDKNSEETIAKMFDQYELASLGVPSLDAFMKVYIEINNRLWSEINRGLITKAELRDARFYETLLRFNIDDKERANKMGEYYLEECPKQPHLLDGTMEILDYLKDKYKLGIITNGFVKTQWIKLESTGLKPYFEVVSIAEELGIHKPHPSIFEHNMKGFDNNYSVEDFIMIGDHWEGDIEGAKNIGMDQIYLNLKGENREGQCSFVIDHLLEIKNIL
jgi:putative hydrolase of the HAD superfamily